jgi:hypothetical protein
MRRINRGRVEKAIRNSKRIYLNAAFDGVLPGRTVVSTVMVYMTPPAVTRLSINTIVRFSIEEQLNGRLQLPQNVPTIG